ncbi:MAG: DUF917 family protein [Desulfobacterium sp.]|nr:DUF917 family protein [Desulfobacterium sp.]
MEEAEKDAIVEYSSDDLNYFIEGATLLATGGGGPKEVAKDLLDQSGVTSVKTIPSQSVPNYMKIAMTGQVFAPSAIWSNMDFTSALNSYNSLVPEGSVRGVLPIEVGAVNGIVPAIIAGMTDSFLIAGAQIDRSMSQMDMGLFQKNVGFNNLHMVTKDGEVAAEIPYAPQATDAMVLETDILNTMNNHPGFQGVGGFASYSMTGADLKHHYDKGLLIGNTFDYAIKLGRSMDAPDFENQVLNTIQEHTGPAYRPYQLFKGYLVNAAEQAHAQDYGCVDFITSDPTSCTGARIYYSNENMIAYHLLWVLVQGVPTPLELGPMVIGPDAVSYLLMEGESQHFKQGHSFSNEAFDTTHGDPDFFRAHEIELIGIPEPRLRTKAILDSFTREITTTRNAFDQPYTGSFIPIEQLNSLCPRIDMPRAEGTLGGDGHITLTTGIPGAEIRYTLDGTEPNQDAQLYTEPIPSSTLSGCDINAKLFHNNGLPDLSLCVSFPTL